MILHVTSTFASLARASKPIIRVHRMTHHLLESICLSIYLSICPSNFAFFSESFLSSISLFVPWPVYLAIWLISNWSLLFPFEVTGFIYQKPLRTGSGLIQSNLLISYRRSKENNQNNICVYVCVYTHMHVVIKR